MSSLRVRTIILLCAAVVVCGGIALSARFVDIGQGKATIGKQAEGVYFVPTGQALTPAGKDYPFDGRPLDLALQPGGKLLAVLLHNEVRLFDTRSGAWLPGSVPGEHDFGGLAWSPDGATLYTTGTAPDISSDDRRARVGVVWVTSIDGAGRAASHRPIRFPLDSRIQPNIKAQDSEPCGLAVSPDGSRLFVSLFNNATLAAVDLKSYDPETGSATITQALVGSSPESVVVAASGAKVYVADRGGHAPEKGDTMDFADPVVVDPATYKAASGAVSVVDAQKLASDPSTAVVKTIPVGLAPASLTASADGRLLFVANANSDAISVIETGGDTVVETIPTSPAPGMLAESSPNGLALSADGKTLYVTLGGDNAIEVLALDTAAGGDAPRTSIAGLIPTAWFPLAVRLDSRQGTLYVANSKGIGSLGAEQTHRRSEGASMPEMGPSGALANGTLTGHSVYAVVGSLSAIPVPDGRALRRETLQVARDNHFDRMQSALAQTPDRFWTRFKHVILVIKENRTYDQLLGDIPVPPGHPGGDPKLVMFGERVTPNHHALARQFGLFDNLYCSGEISADGHHWLNEAFADDYDERAMDNYPRSYPCCGTDPLVYAGNPFLWQAALQSGLTFRDYGEFPPLPSMRRHADNSYMGLYSVGPNRNEDVVHFERLQDDLDKNGLAQLTYVWFPDDHTQGTRPGSFAPESCVADNDLALGKLVDAISHNPKYWRDEPTVIFVVEDDAQGGLDHVEGHRTVGLVISPYNRRGTVYSTNYNQLSMLRTIEVVLGMKPLNQFDAAAMPMREVFQDRPDQAPYEARQNQIALNLRNPPLTRTSAAARHWEAVSASLDFSAPDRADPEKLTEVLWHHTHGEAAYPPVDAARW